VIRRWTLPDKLEDAMQPPIEIFFDSPWICPMNTIGVGCGYHGSRLLGDWPFASSVRRMALRLVWQVCVWHTLVFIAYTIKHGHIS